MKLAPGSIILVEAIAKCVEGDGVVAVSLHGDNRWRNYAFDCIYAKPEPKYNPRRLFKTGDKVRVVEWNGRKVHDPMNGSVWTVNRNECNGGIAHESILVSLFYEDDNEGHIIDIPPCFLELVTPVEELEPYSAREYEDFYAVEKDGAQYSIFFKGSYHSHAKAAAEAERDRLNSEHRKEDKQ